MGSTTATLQTPPGRGGIAVILLRGPDCLRLLERVFRPFRGHAAGGEDVLRLGHVVAGGETIDEAIVGWAACRPPDDAPAIPCAADAAHPTLCEINIHGGPTAARRTLEALVAAGAVASPSVPAATETFGASHPRWNNPAIGREMLAALPSARSEPAVLALTRQWSAGLSELVAGALAGGTGGAGELRSRLLAAAEGLSVMRRLLEPAEVVLAGPPNVGKSTLANALVGRQVSIVDSAPGTTRDWVRELAVFAGVPVWLTDTAGLWDAADGIDAEAVRRARRRAEVADLVLLLSADRPTPAPPWLCARSVVHVWAKADLSAPPAGFPGPAVSAHTGVGLDQLRQAAIAALGLPAIDPTAAMAFTARQADLLHRAARAIEVGDTAAVTQSLDGLLREPR